MRINQLVDKALCCVEQAHKASAEGKDPSAMIAEANRILKREIGSHPDRLAFFKNKNSPFLGVYVELLQQVDRMMYPLAEEHAGAKPQSQVQAAPEAEPRAEPRAGQSPPKQELAQRFANIRRKPVGDPPSGPISGPSSGPPSAAPAPQRVRPPIPKVAPVNLPVQTDISPQSLHKLLLEHAEKVLVLDIRDKASYSEYHLDVPKSACIEYFRLRENMTQMDLEDLVLVSSREDQRAFASRGSCRLVVLVDDGSHPQELKHLRNALQDLKVLELAGGINAWLSYNLPTINSEPSPEPPDPFEQVLLREGTIRVQNGIVSQKPLVRYDNATSPPPPPPPPHHAIAHRPPPVPPTHHHHQNTRPPPFKPIMCGLKNLGNTCYQNCILQCLFGTPELVAAFQNGAYQRLINPRSRLGYGGRLAHEFARLVVMASGAPPNTFIAAFDLKQLAGSLQDTFLGYDQQDCQEFLTFLLDGLHEELNSAGDSPHQPALTEDQERMRESFDMRVAAAIEWERYMTTNASLVVDEIQGQYASRLQCTVCQTTSTTYTAFSTLTLPIIKSRKSVELLDCFNAFVAPQILDGENAWFCPNCKKKQKTLQSLRLSRLPNVLIIHLKRFRQKRTISGIQADKFEATVRYPIYHLDLGAYAPDTRPLVPRDAEVYARIPGRSPEAPYLYDLYAVATHHGSLKSGHYTAFVRKDQWYYMDDTNVVPLRDNNVVTRNAYVLFYQRRNNI